MKDTFCNIYKIFNKIRMKIRFKLVIFSMLFLFLLIIPSVFSLTRQNTTRDTYTSERFPNNNYGSVVLIYAQRNSYPNDNWLFFGFNTTGVFMDNGSISIFSEVNTFGDGDIMFFYCSGDLIEESLTWNGQAAAMTGCDSTPFNTTPATVPVGDNSYYTFAGIPNGKGNEKFFIYVNATGTPNVYWGVASSESGTVDSVAFITFDSVSLDINDTTPPNITIFSPVSQEYTIPKIKLNWSSSENLSSIGYSLNSAPNISITGINNITLVIENGSNTIQLWATDINGNVGNSSIVSFNVSIPIRNPRYYWNLDETTGTNAGEIVYSLINGTANTGSWVPGKINNGFEGFGDNTAYIDLDTSTNMDLVTVTKLTTSLWVRFNSTHQKQSVVSGQRYAIGISPEDVPNCGDNLTGVYYDGSNSKATCADIIPEVNTWYHIVYVVDTDNDWQKLYVNNVLSGETAHVENFAFSGSHYWAIGYRGQTQPASYLNGTVDEVGIWKNITLAETEIGILFNFTYGNSFPFSPVALDIVPPVITIINPVEGATYISSNIDLNWTINKLTNWIRYSLNGAANVTITENITLLLSNGAYNVQMWANDTFGNIGKSSLINFDVAIKSPTYSNFSNNASIVTLINGSVNFSIVIQDDVGLSYAIFEHNSSGILVNETPIVLSGTSDSISTIISPINIVRAFICGKYYMNDTSGYENSTNLSCFTVTNSPPAIPSIISPENGEYYFSVNINVSSSDNDGDVITFYIYIDDVFNTTTVVNITDFSIGDGNFTLKISAYDTYDWSANSSEVNFIKDTIPPIFSNSQINSTPKMNEYINMSITIADISADKYRFFWNNSGSYVNDTAISYNDGDTISVVKQVTVAHGYICWGYWANDTVANNNNSIISCFTVINTPPNNLQILSPTNNSMINTSTVNFNFTANDEDGDSLTFTRIINNQINGTGNTTLEMDDGYYNLSLNVSDGRNVTLLSYITFTVDATYPSVDIIFPTDDYLSLVTDVDLNISIYDTLKLDGCWFTRDGGDRNYSICPLVGNEYQPTNVTMYELPIEAHTVVVCANDTIGHETCDTVDFGVANAPTIMEPTYPVDNQKIPRNGTDINWNEYEHNIYTTGFPLNTPYNNTIIVKNSTNETVIAIISNPNTPYYNTTIYDDFPGTSLNTTLWTETITNNGVVEVSDSYLRLVSFNSAPSQADIASVTSITDFSNKVVDFIFNIQTTGGAGCARYSRILINNGTSDNLFKQIQDTGAGSPGTIDARIIFNPNGVVTLINRSDNSLMINKTFNYNVNYLILQSFIDNPTGGGCLQYINVTVDIVNVTNINTSQTNTSVHWSAADWSPGSYDIVMYSCSIYGCGDNATINNVTINLIPITNTTYILPTIAYNNDTLFGYANITDADGDTQTVDYIFFRNGEIYSNGSIGGITSANDQLISNASGFGVDNNITFSARTYDGYDYSGWVNSSIRNITNRLLRDLTIYTPPNNTLTNLSLNPIFSVIDEDGGINCTGMINGSFQYRATESDPLNHGSYYNILLKEEVNFSHSGTESPANPYKDVKDNTSYYINTENAQYTSFDDTEDGGIVTFNFTAPVNITSVSIINYQLADSFSNGTYTVNCSKSGDSNDWVTLLYEDNPAQLNLTNITYTECKAIRYHTLGCTDVWCTVWEVMAMFEDINITSLSILTNVVSGANSTFKNVTLTEDGDYIWNISCVANGDSPGLFSGNYYFIYDTIPVTFSNFQTDESFMYPQIGDTFHMNVTLYDAHNASFCSLYLNDTGTWQNKENYTIPGNATYVLEMEYVIQNYTQADNDTLGWRVWCNDTIGNGNTSDTQVFTVKDISLPLIVLGNDTNIANNSVISSYLYNITYNITYFDYNLFQTMINITCGINGTIYYWEILDINGTTLTQAGTVNLTDLEPQSCIFSTSASDDHTVASIDDYDVLELEDGLRFTTPEGNVITVRETAGQDIIREAKAIKGTDRYNFEFDFIEGVSEIKFTLEADSKIYYRANTDYSGHFVVWNEETKRGNWIDFVSKEDKIDKWNIVRESDYEYEIEIEFKEEEEGIMFESIGGTNVENSTFDFYIGAMLNITTFNVYDNSTFDNFTFDVSSIASSSVFENRSYNVTGNSYLLQNISNGTYRLNYVRPHEYFNQTVILNITEIYERTNYSTFQAVINIIMTNIKTSNIIEGMEVTVIENSTNISYTEITDSEGISRFYLNKGNYSFSTNKTNYPDFSSSFLLEFHENRTTIYTIPYTARFILVDERTLEGFNISSADTISFLLFCPDTTTTTLINESAQSVPIDCDFTKFKFVLVYGSESYYRTLLYDPEDIVEPYNTTIYLIDLTTTQSIYNTFIAEDILTTYQNPSIYVKKLIDDTTPQITADFTDIENKIGAYLIQNHEYIMELHSDNNPTLVLGTYNADLAGEKILTLIDVSLVGIPSGWTDDVTLATSLANDTNSNTVYAIAIYNDTSNGTSSITWSLYRDRYEGTLLFTDTLVDTSSVLFRYNVTDYLNYTLVSNIEATYVGVEHQHGRIINSVSTVYLEIMNYIPQAFMDWFLTLFLGMLALAATIKSANSISFMLIGLATLFIMFGWYSLSWSILILAATIALISFLKSEDKRIV